MVPAALTRLGCGIGHAFAEAQPVEFGQFLIDYFDYRKRILNDYVQQLFMDAEEAVSLNRLRTWIWLWSAVHKKARAYEKQETWLRSPNTGQSTSSHPKVEDISKVNAPGPLARSVLTWTELDLRRHNSGHNASLE